MYKIPQKLTIFGYQVIFNDSINIKLVTRILSDHFLSIYWKKLVIRGVGIYINNKVTLSASDVALFNSILEVNSNMPCILITTPVSGKNRKYVFVLNKAKEVKEIWKITEDDDEKILLGSDFEWTMYAKGLGIPVIENCATFYIGGYFVFKTQAFSREYSAINKKVSNYPSALIEKLHSKDHVEMKRITDLSWYNSKIEQVVQEKLHIPEQILNRWILTCPVHGDFGSKNIFVRKNSISEFDDMIIIDWEKAHWDGPYYLDLISYAIGARHKAIKSRLRSKNLSNQIYLEIKSFYSINRFDFLISLLFLYAVDFDLAELLLRDMKFENWL